MKHTLFTTLLLMPLAALPAAELRDTFADAWPATDALGRTLPLHQEAGGRRADRFVGIFYFNWQASFTGPPFNHTRVFDNTKLIAANPNKPAWGPPGIPHYWGEPRFGYYRPDDPWVIRKHVQMLTDAGVDVLIFDVTTAPPTTTNARLCAWCSSRCAPRGGACRRSRCSRTRSTTW